MIKKKIKTILDNWQPIPYSKICSLIDHYSEVSFDIFDTIIKRDTPTPIDVFEVIEAVVPEQDFAKRRVDAERRARKKKKEVTLDDIYEEYQGIPEQRKSLLRNIEIEYEINLCVVNIKMLPIFHYACKHKRVFLLSDMYLSKETIVRILSNNGISGYEDVLVSNEIDKTKSDGSLYSYTLEHYNCKKMLHIGNDFVADYYRARCKGVASAKIRTNTCNLSRRYRDADKDKRTMYLESFLSNRHDDRNDEYYTFGFERFGPVLYGFSVWLFENLKRNNIEEVWFMARDGYIMREAYHLLGYHNVIPDRYFEASRRSLRVPSYSKSVELKDVMKSTPLL